MKLLTIVVAVALFVASQVTSFACGLEGFATRTDGSKVEGTARVSTSWGSNTAYPRGGYYKLDLGSSACGEKVTVYVNGIDMGMHKLPKSGYLRFDFTLKGTTDTPVR